MEKAQPATMATPRRDIVLAYRADNAVQKISLTGFGVRTVLDEGMEIEGDIKSASSVAIKGILRGSLHVRGESGLVIVFPGAKIEGRVRARFVWLAGELRGRIECGRLLILQSGHFSGESVCETLEVKHGGEYLPTSVLKERFDTSL